MKSNHQLLITCAFLVAGAALLSGCGERPPVDTVQWGYRGTGMEQVYNPRLVQPIAARNQVPEPLAPADPAGPRAAEVYQNVQVLRDLSVGEFTRVMLAMTAWVAPQDQSCSYCHSADMADGSKYQYQVARRMLQMTRHVNSEWKAHVGEAGVTCFTCHRGNQIPRYTWFTDPGPTENGVISTRAQQNLPARSVGLSSLPYDPFTPFLLENAAIRVNGTQPLPGTNRASIQQAEWTYGLMMHMSGSLGVNCTYCHNTRSWGAWNSDSTPQRATAWHGIRMVRELNVDYLVPLTPIVPANQHGPLGDIAKVNCQTCHQGVYKPFFGTSIAKDYPELQGARAMPAALPTADAASDAGGAPALPVGVVYFDVGRPSPITDGRASLDPVVGFLAANPGASVSISGYHDPTGDRARNEELAKQRAVHVRDQLVAAGVDAARIALDKPRETTGTGDLPEARRVEVTVVQP